MRTVPDGRAAHGAALGKSVGPLVPLILLLTALNGLACRTADDGLLIHRLDVSLNVLGDGSVEVEEQIHARSGATPVSSFRRHLPGWRNDGVSAVSGSMAGKESAPGDEAGHLAISPGPALDATWHFAASTNAEHVFRLRYRAANAVEISGIRGTVAWRLVDENHDYERARVCVRLTIPSGAVLLENPGFEEPARVLPGEKASPDALCAEAVRGQSLTRRATFTIDTMSASEPVWQYYARRSRDLMPAFITTGLSIVAVGIGIVALVWFKYPRLRPRQTPDDTAVPPSLESALAGPRPSVDALESLIESGLVDRERVTAARDLRRAGIVTLLVGAASWIVLGRMFSHLGPWPLAIPLSILFCGALFVVSAPRLSILSQNGQNARARVLYSARVRDGRTPV